MFNFPQQLIAIRSLYNMSICCLTGNAQKLIFVVIVGAVCDGTRMY